MRIFLSKATNKINILRIKYKTDLDCIVLVPESTEARESLFSRLSLLYGLWLKGTAFSIHLRCSRSAIVPESEFIIIFSTGLFYIAI